MTDIRLKIHDLDALAEACEKLGLELHYGKTRYAWWGKFQYDSNAYGEHRPEDMGTCAHAIRIKGDVPNDGPNGPWEVGVVKAKDGDGYNLYYDTYGNTGRLLTQAVGENANGIRREYAAAVATKKSIEKLSRHGWRTVREDLPGDRIKIRLVKR